MLDRVVVLATAGDLEASCRELGAATSMCRTHIELAGAPRPAADAPVVISSADVGDQPAPGRLLTVCGIDALGNRFESDFLVLRQDGKLVVPYPVYWSGFHIKLPEGPPPVTSAAAPGDRLAMCKAAGVF